MIRLAIAAPSAVVRAGLEALARSDPEIELVGSFSDLAALDGSRQSDMEALRPDVILAAVPLEDLAPTGGAPFDRLRARVDARHAAGGRPGGIAASSLGGRNSVGRRCCG